jgi:hypothetical protein
MDKTLQILLNRLYATDKAGDMGLLNMPHNPISRLVMIVHAEIVSLEPQNNLGMEQFDLLKIYGDFNQW